MTKSDKWKHRKCVDDYFSFKDKLILASNKAGLPELPSEIKSVIFFIQMPETWSKQTKLKMDGVPHQQIPDVDNCLKAFLDCLLKQDNYIWSIQVRKYWSIKGRIEIDI
jgi:Holliday junction resolvase RusA-like endonuclease